MISHDQQPRACLSQDIVSNNKPNSFVGTCKQLHQQISSLAWLSDTSMTLLSRTGNVICLIMAILLVAGNFSAQIIIPTNTLATYELPTNSVMHAAMVHGKVVPVVDNNIATWGEVTNGNYVTIHETNAEGQFIGICVIVELGLQGRDETYHNLMPTPGFNIVEQCQTPIGDCIHIAWTNMPTFGEDVLLQRTTDLISWTNVTDRYLSGSGDEWLDDNTPLPMAVYRVVTK
jgi:hypothetical protein